MEKNIKEFFKTGIVHFMAFPDAMHDNKKYIETVKKIATDDYFEVIEIASVEDPETKNAVKNIIQISGLELFIAAQPLMLRNNLNINDLDERVREKTIETLKRFIDQAYEMGAKGISFLSGRYNETTKEESFELLVDSTEKICEYAKAKGTMKVELEVFDYDVDKRSLIGPSFLAAKFAERIRKKYENFGLMIDLSHLPLLREKPAETITSLKDFITHLHIGNCYIADRNSSVYGDQHVPFGFPGSQISIEQVAEFLQTFIDTVFFDSNRRIPLSFEVKPLAGQCPEIVIANSKRTLQHAWLFVQ